MFVRRNRDVAGVLAGTAVLIISGTIARRGVSRAELQAFRVANRAPDVAFPVIWVPMQYGTYGTVPTMSTMVLLRGRRRLAVALALAGTAAWLLAKAAKPAVGRGRPAGAVAGAVVRGVEEDDEGFPSGHAAVSAALTTVASPYLHGTPRCVLGTLSAVVPLARLYVGAHLPLDAIGGSVLGVTAGCPVNLLLGVPKDRSTRAPRR